MVWKMTRAIYPGTFDPITYGHIDVAKRAAQVFESLVIVVMNNLQKRYTFTFEERAQMIQDIFEKDTKIHVDTHNGLLVEYVKHHQVDAVVRGLRAVSDFEFEMQMAAANKHLYNRLDTFFLMTDTQFSFISSTLVKEIFYHGGKIDQWVPPIVELKLRQKFSSMQNE